MNCFLISGRRRALHGLIVLCALVPALANAALTIGLTKSDGTGYVANGSTVVFTYTVSPGNTGNTTNGSTIWVTNVLPAGMSWPSTTTIGGPNAANWGCAPTGQTISCSSTTQISNNSSSVFTLQATVGTGLSNGALLINQARVGGGGSTVSGYLTTQPTTAQVQACSTSTQNSPQGCSFDTDTVAVGRAILHVVKTNPQNSIRGPGINQYQYTITNTGDTATSGTINFHDTLDSTQSMTWYISGTAAFQGVTGSDAGRWTCTAPTISTTDLDCSTTTSIPPGGSLTFDLQPYRSSNNNNNKTTINKALISGGNAINLSTAANSTNTALCTDNGTPTDGCTTVTTTITAGQNDVFMTKTDNAPGSLRSPGDSVSFFLTIYSPKQDIGAGNNINVIDILPAGLTFVSASSACFGTNIGQNNCTAAGFGGPPFNCSNSSGTVTCSQNGSVGIHHDGNFAGGAQITIVATVAGGATNANTINLAQVGTNNIDPRNTSLATPSSASACSKTDNMQPNVGCAYDAILVGKQAYVSISKTNSTDPNTYGKQCTYYLLKVQNAGPDAADGSVVTDPVATQQNISLTDFSQCNNACNPSTIQCTQSGGAACPAVLSASSLQSPGLVIPTLPSGGAVTLTVPACVTATGQ